MTRDEVLNAALPGGHHVETRGGIFYGQGTMADRHVATVLGIQDAAFLGIDDAALLSNVVLRALSGPTQPIVVVIDSRSQKMAKRDELLGLSQFLSHLAQTLLLANLNGFSTIGVLYGQSAAGAFIATALATHALIALPEAHPAVMDLPSMARVTKLPLETLEEKAKGTPIFAPGLENLAKTGAVSVTVTLATLARSLVDIASAAEGTVDQRDRLGQSRGGRTKAAEVAAAVYRAAVQET